MRVERWLLAAMADRTGVVATGDPTALQQAGVNWYETFGYSSGVPAGMSRAAVVRLNPPPDLDALAEAASENPGAAWVIGNEPNVPTVSTSDNLSPSDYATWLNILEGVIHGSDPTALIVGPNVLNWSDTCVGCGGYTAGADWARQFYTAYTQQFGTRPPIDRWAVHTYELNWQDTPTLHTDFHVRQLTALRGWLDGIHDEAGRPIWDTELGFHWAYAGWKFDSHHKIVPVGSYDEAGVERWLSTMLNWLSGSGSRLGVARAFFYAQAPGAEGFAETYGGLALFDGRGADAALTPVGQALANYLGAGSTSGR